MAATTSRTQTLMAQLSESGALSRPIITYINGDVSWLVSFPRPPSEKTANSKAYYHVVIDPWFGQTPSVVISVYLLEMKLGRDAGIPNRTALDTAITEIEAAAGCTVIPIDASPAVDAIFITGPAEHSHKESLLQFSSSTPLFAATAEAKAARSWKYFETVVDLKSCDSSKTSWTGSHPGAPLPKWLTAFSPVLTAFNTMGVAFITSANNSENELVLQAGHGVWADEPSLNSLIKEVKTLALVLPLKESFSFGIKTVRGVEEGLALSKAAKSRYYVRQGDFASLKYRGILGLTVNDVNHDWKWGYEKLGLDFVDGKHHEGPIRVEVENGGSYVLA